MKPTNELKPLIDALLARFGENDSGLIAAVDLAVLVAMADERIDAGEMAALVTSIEAIMGGRVATSVAKHLVTESRANIRAAGAEARARAIGEAPAAHAAGEDGLRVAIAIAWASEGVSSQEKAAIAHVAEAAGVSAARVDELIAAATPAEA